VADPNLIQRQVFFEETPSISSGIERVDIDNGGINYSTIPTVTITGDGAGAVGVAKIYGGRVTSIDLTNKGTNYTRASVTLSGDTGSGAKVIPILQTRIGKLRTYYLKENGEKVFLNLNAGTIDYGTGTIVLQSLNPLAVTSNDYYETNVLTINIPVDKEIITSIRNKIIDIDMDDPLAIQIQVIPEA
jgi:hypothetical protein